MNGDGGLVHWDDVEPVRDDEGHFGGAWRFLGREAGCVEVTVSRIEISPGRWSTPAHVEDEEVFFVLGGSGLSWQDGKVYEVREGDCIVHRARKEAHTLRGGDTGLDVLVFGRRGGDGHATLPRAGVTWLGSSWVASGQGGHPWDQEAAAGEPEVGDAEERPANIVNVGDLEQERWIDLADAAGSVKSGLNVVTIGPGKLPAPAHSHSAEEEIFAVLEGDGTLELVPNPRARDRGHEEEHHPIRAGHVISRPAGTQIAHAFRGGENGMRMLMYGWRNTNDITYYPRSNKLAFRGVGLIARLEPLDYWDGEEPPG
ncbi:MAG TPA: cupin domain-containing protein [Gaiellaceae bacterium]|nr:cupin domain-containing protein [Gaiellaceae bacterium]